MKRWKPKLPTGYNEQTYASPYAIVRYPHEKRYEMGARSTVDAKPRSVLDYGAGDGKVLIEADRLGLPGDTQIVAYEPMEHFRRQLVSSTAALNVDVVSDRSALRGPFDYILCLGVLEHMPLPERSAFYRVCNDTLATDGTVLVDVPVEVGPTLLVKATARRLLKGRDREYSIRELVRITLGGHVFDPARFDPASTETWIQQHRGFDYRLLRAEIASQLRLVAETTTPIRILPAAMGNQEVFLTLKRSS